MMEMCCHAGSTSSDFSLISNMHSKLMFSRKIAQNIFSTDGDILCDGYAARSAWTAGTVYCMFIQCSSQVQHIIVSTGAIV